MNTKISTLICRAGALSSAVLILAGVPSRAADKVQVDAFPNFDSYVKITGQGASISGSETAFQSRAKQPSSGGFGIEDLHILKDVSKTTTLVIDGKALAGVEDYLGKFNVTKSEVGSVEVGYKRFRTFYDGVGGFFPTNKQWNKLSNQDLHIDRSKFWAEATLAIPNAPVFTLRYTDELRSGQKDSTIWGTSDFTGLPFNLAPNPINPGRKMTPSYINVDERHEMIELTARHTIKNTTVELKVFGDRTNNLDTRYVTNYPGEVIPWSIASLSNSAPTGQVASPQAIAKAAATPANWNNQVDIAETDGMITKTGGVTFEADTILTDTLTLKVNGSYELIHTAVSGGRPLVTYTPTSTGTVPVTTDNYAGLTGGSRVADYVGSVALDWKPAKDLFFKLAFRGQDEYVRGTSSYNAIAASGTPATTLATTPRTGWAKLHQNVRTPVLEVRYTGIKDLALYFTGSKRDLNGEEHNTSSYNPLTAGNGTLANQNVKEDHINYTAGANWRAAQSFTLRGEYFHKGHKDNTSGFGVNVGDYYLLDSVYSGFKVSAIFKPLPELGFTTRYIHQKGTMQVTGFLPTFPAYDSLDSVNHTVSESIDWTPNQSIYVQLNGNFVYNVISTIYPRAGITPAVVNATSGLTTANAFDTNQVLQNSNNNYVTANFITGWVMDKATDAQVQVNYYHADNNNAFLTPLTMPYGVVVKDMSYTVGVKHKFNDKWVGNAKLGYFDSVNDTTGGMANYHGPMAYVSFDYGL